MAKVVCFIKKTKFFIERSQHKYDDNINANNTLNIEYPKGEETLEDFVIRVCEKYGPEVLDNKWSGNYKELMGHTYYGEERQFHHVIETAKTDYSNAKQQINQLRKSPSFNRRLITEVYKFKVNKINYISDSKYECIYDNGSEHYDIPFLLKAQFKWGTVSDEIKFMVENTNLLGLDERKEKIQDYVVSLSRQDGKLWLSLENEQTGEFDHISISIDIEILDETAVYMADDIISYILHK